MVVRNLSLSLSDVASRSLVFWSLAKRTAGDPCIVLSLFLSATVNGGRCVAGGLGCKVLGFEIGFVVDGFIVVEFLTLGRVLVGLFESVLEVRLVEVDVLLILVGLIVDVEDTIDALLGLTETPSPLDSSPDVLLSIDTTELRFLLVIIVREEVVLLAGLRRVERGLASVGVNGLAEGVSFGFARLESRAEVIGFVAGFVAAFRSDAAVPGRCEELSSPEAS